MVLTKVQVAGEFILMFVFQMTITSAKLRLSLQDFFGKSDPYLEFAKENPDGTFTTTYRTQVHIDL